MSGARTKLTFGLPSVRLRSSSFQRHPVVTTLTACVVAVLATVLSLLFAIDTDGQSDHGVLQSVMGDSDGVLLLGHIYNIDLTTRTVDVSWMLVGCGAEKLDGSSVHDSQWCGFPKTPIEVYVENVPTPVASYDPSALIRDSMARFSPYFYIQSTFMFQHTHLMWFYSQYLQTGGPRRYFDSQFTYPFDGYRVSTSFVALNPTTNTTVPGLKVSFCDFVNNFAPSSGDYRSQTTLNGTTYDSTAAILTLSRTHVVKASSLMLFVVNWALTAVVLGITIIGMLSKNASLGEGILILPVTVVLTIPALRVLFIGEPPFGILMDILGFFLEMLIVAACSVIILVKIGVTSAVDRPEEQLMEKTTVGLSGENTPLLPG